MFRSIRWRLVASHVFLTLLVVGLAGLMGLWGVRHYAHQRETEYLTVTANSIAQRALPLMSPQVSPDQLTQLAQTASFFSNVRVVILDEKHQVLTDTGHPNPRGEVAWFIFSRDRDKYFYTIPYATPPEDWAVGITPARPFPFQERLPHSLIEIDPEMAVTIIRRAEEPFGSHFEFIPVPEAEIRIPPTEAPSVEISPQSGRVVSVPIGDTDTPLGYVQLNAGTDFGAEALASTWQPFLIAGSGAVLLAMILGLVMGRRLSKPITDLNATARQMSAGDLSVRAPVKGRDEIGELAAQFNQMAKQLQSSFEQLATERDTLRRFIADASHELRTPITALKNFNVLLLGAASDDPEARLEFLTECQAQIDRLTWITQNLLDLSRLEAGLAALELDSHDARALVNNVLGSYKERAAEKNITIYVDLPDQPIELRCDSQRMEMALSNLVDNALKFTPHGGQVEIGALGQEASVEFQVRDNGAGIHPEDLPHIFERFYRGRNNTQAGSGLGLSIVHSVVQAHGGRVAVESEPGKGTSFQVQIPND